MIEIICNKDESDKNSHHVKEGELMKCHKRIVCQVREQA